MHSLATAQFRALLVQLADAWQQQDTDRALACFTLDSVYMEPPDIQLYRGHAELRPYFDALRPGTFMTFHQSWFDEATQTGSAEYSFGMTGRPQADHGVVVVTLRDGQISFWREYQHKGPAEFARFIATDGKTWQWHIGNYP